MDRATGLALAGLAASLLVSAAVYWYTGWLFVFLFVPFVPFLLRRGGSGDRAGSDAALRRCPECGFTSRDPEVAYCPRDGTRLE